MAHDNYHAMMSLALDRALPPQEQVILHGHLETCLACRSTWDRMCRADALFGQAISVAPSADFTARVMARVAEREAARREAKPWRLAVIIIAGLFAVIMALGVTGLILLGEGNLANGVLRAAAQGQSVIELMGTAAALVRTLVGALRTWLGFLVAQPLVWGAAISALTLASIWLGLIEALKPTPVRAESNA